MTDRDPPIVSRRALLAGGAGLVLGACASDGAAGPDAPDATPSSTTTSSSTTTAAPTTTTAAPAFDGSYPFTLGVASGDPAESSVVLWTRLLAEGGALADGDQLVAWDMAADESFDELVASAETTAPADYAHSVHLVAEGLEPDSWYWYRFRVGEFTSPVGRTRTTAAAGADELRIGWSSCQLWESGTYAAHRHLAEAELDLFVWLGDYIYEYGPDDQGVTSAAGARIHNSDEVIDLDAYRARYAQYKADPWLQRHHAAHPWAVTWDDHEIDNNYAGTQPSTGDAGPEFEARRQAAAQAWWEHMPVRLAPPAGGAFTIHRTIEWGGLTAIHMLDGRQYRAPQPTDGEPTDISGFELQALGPTALDPDHSMLGADQEAWLLGEVERSDATWTVLGNQVYMHGITALPGAPAINPDSWDGYFANRARLLEGLDRTAENLVVLTGDFHAASVAALRSDPFDLDSPVIGTEFMAPAISSQFPEALRDLVPIAVVFNPHVEHFDARNGFMTAVVRPESWTTTLHTLGDVTDEQTAIDSEVTFEVRPGSPAVFGA